MNAKGTIAVVDCDNVRRDGLVSRLTLLGHHVAIIADHLDHYIKASRECPVHVVVVNVGPTDESLPSVNGLLLVAYTRQHQPRVQVLALFQPPDAELPDRAYTAGADSVEDFEHLRADRLDRLVAALLRGDRYHNTYMKERMSRRPSPKTKPAPSGKERLEALTKAQKKVLDLALHPRWHTNKEMGACLNIQVCTVKTHLRDLCRSLGCSTRKGLIPLALREGWLPAAAMSARA